MSSSAKKPKTKNDAQSALLSSIDRLPGIGPRRRDLLRSLGIETIGDLLVSSPRRYIDRKAFSKIKNLSEGDIQTVIASVSRLQVKPGRRQHLFIAWVEDVSGRMRCLWFNQPYLRNVFRPGDTYVFSGRVSSDVFGRVFVHPEYEKAESELLHTGRVVPVYRTRPGLGQKRIRVLVKHALDGYLAAVKDCLPCSVKERLGLVSLSGAIRALHFPSDLSEAESARRRLAFDEMLLFQTLFALARLQTKDAGRPAQVSGETVSRWSLHLPFSLTASQGSALETIIADLDSPYPMRRLLQGDVGCGKTIIATIAAGVVCARRGQVAIMCPTEILADQHYATIKGYLDSLGFSVGLLSGSMSQAEKDRTTRELETGAIEVIIGTHALIGERVRFRNLRLIVVDEEQRFGVLQRMALLEKEPDANLLVITATPIPRTLALTAYGDLDITVIREMPPGRGRHTTTLVTEDLRRETLKRIARKIDHDSQGFYVCPALEEGEAGLADVRTARDEIGRMLEDAGRIGILTGRTGPEERAAVIRDFRSNKIGLIVATTVIEVGMDIPSATILVVDQAERFGLSQLHQMRGRVSRTDAESYSYLLVSGSASDKAWARLRALESTFDGFEIAEKDLMLRGPGDMVGTRQHGVPDLRFASLPLDMDLMLAAKDEAFEHVLEHDRSSEWQAWMNAVRGVTEGRIAMV